MNEQQLRELRLALGLPETADAALCITSARTANAAIAQLTERESALQTANSTVSTLNGERDTLRTQHGSLTKQLEDLQTANTVFIKDADTFRDAFLELAVKAAAVTPAERMGFAQQLSTANSREATLADIIGAQGKPARKAMNTQAVEINGTRLDISTANARQDALQTAVGKRMKQDECDYDTAYARVKGDKNFAGLFAAMQDPAKAAA